MVKDMKLTGFHIDMNIGQFRRDYLEKHLAELKDIGYNAIVWEIENNVRWESCPECVSPDAFTKEEFRKILDYSSRLGFENIPLLQTLGHAEYVLKHERYAEMRELPNEVSQYCPLHPGIEKWFRRWIKEYLDLFGPVHYFHLGLDEAWFLGKCPKCRGYAAEHGKGALFFHHVNKILGLVPRRIRPMMWADMVLRHPECLEKLDKRVLLLDWNYDCYEGREDVYFWEYHDWRTPAQFTETEFRRYGNTLSARGFEDGRTPNPFFTSDYLTEHGFQVVHCPSSASGDDNVFAPRHILHLRNTCSQFRAGEKHRGTIQTSWTLRIHPWELQELSIQVPRWLKTDPTLSWEQCEKKFEQDYFGLETDTFAYACSLLSPPVPFASNASLGFGKHTFMVDPGHVRRMMQQYRYDGEIPSLTASAARREMECKKAVQLFSELVRKVRRHKDVMQIHLNAAKQLALRAETAHFLLNRYEEIIAGESLSAVSRKKAEQLLKKNKTAKESFIRQYLGFWKKTRTQECASWIFDAVIEELSVLTGERRFRGVPTAYEQGGR